MENIGKLKWNLKKFELLDKNGKENNDWKRFLFLEKSEKEKKVKRVFDILF